MEIYFDNSATTPCRREVADFMYKINTEEYGNPSSMHHAGVVAENHVKKAKETISSLLKAEPGEIYFTSGGTESDNMAIIGGAMAHRRRGDHIITTAVEHPAVKNAVKYLAKEGFRVTELPVYEDGRISCDDLKNALSPDTILVSIMHTNNETGSLMPVAQAGKIIKETVPGALFHVDAVQGFGREWIYPGRMGIDLLSVSSHKIHGPKGCGFLYKSKKARILPLLHGGGQQDDIRPGTENVAGIAGMALASELIYKDLDSINGVLTDINRRIREGAAAIGDVYINSPDMKYTSPHVVNISFKGVRSEVLLHALEEKGVYVSSGSACASNKKDRFSDTLSAMGLSKELMDSAIRFSFSIQNTLEEADRVVDALRDLVPVLRRYSPGR